MKNLMNFSLRAQGPIKGTLKKVAKLLTLSIQGELFGPGLKRIKTYIFKGVSCPNIIRLSTFNIILHIPLPISYSYFTHIPPFLVLSRNPRLALP